MERFARGYTCAGLALIVVAALTGAGTRWDTVPWLLGSLLGLVGITVGLRVHRPRERSFWVALATMEACWAAAAVVPLLGVAKVESAGYSLSSALYLPGYAALAWATISFLRRIGLGRAETFDAAIATALVAAALWPVVQASVNHNGRSIWLACLFPFWDILLAMLVVRVSFSGWFRKRAVSRLAGATVLLLVSDLAYFSGTLDSSSLAARALSVTYTAAYVGFGAAAIGRSMRRLPPRSLLREDSRTARRRTIAVVAVALTVPLVIFGVDEVRERAYSQLALVVLALIVVVLVVARISRLLRHSDELRRRAEESERLFRMVFDAAGVGISVGANGVMERTNPALQRMWGYTGEELAAMHFLDTTHPDDRSFDTVPVAGRTYTFEKRYITKSGETRWAEVTLTAPPDDSFGIAVIDDITTAKQLEEDLRQAQKMEAVGQLAGGIAHDFNNLMTAVIGYASMLRREIPSGDHRYPRVEAISSAAERAAELTKKLLAFSRRQVLRLEPVDLAEAVRNFEQILDRLLPENIVVDHSLEAGAVARVDRAELEQVLLNLVLNASDAMPKGGLLSIVVRTAGAAVELSVTDTGLGMSEETRRRSFDPFFTTKPVGQGTGLGLSTVDGIVAQLGGTIDVQSELGVGTTFTISLPRAVDAPAHEAALQETAVASRRHGAVLLVEDEEIVRRVTEEMLRLCGYDVVATSSGENALTLLEGGMRPDVLVSDVVMTGIGGPALVERARRLVPDLPVVFVTGYPAESFGDEMTDLVLTKPFTPARLAESIEAVRRAAVAA